MWWSDGRDRASHCCSDKAPRSTESLCCLRFRESLLRRHFCASMSAGYVCAPKTAIVTRWRIPRPTPRTLTPFSVTDSAPRCVADPLSGTPSGSEAPFRPVHPQLQRFKTHSSFAPNRRGFLHLLRIETTAATTFTLHQTSSAGGRGASDTVRIKCASDTVRIKLLPIRSESNIGRYFRAADFVAVSPS